jgi:hypothetical protein
MAAPRVKREVSATELRHMFSASDYPDRIASGRLRAHIIYERRLPAGGLSRIMAYTEPHQTVKLVVLHQRTRADGSVTEPDPKLVVVEGISYWAK